MMRRAWWTAGVVGGWIAWGALAGGASLAAAEREWRPAEGRLMTEWAGEVSPENALPEYPRPQLVRERWQSLNGLWDYALRPRGEAAPAGWDGRILVPFAVESALSGVGRTVGPEQKLWYRRTFTVPAEWRKDRLLLHFGAVDWEATVWLNGQAVGEHRGGYTPFTCDLTDALSPEEEQELTVSVWDPSDAGYQPRGKQVQRPHGIWYTSVTGIWQTVWLEPVPQRRIARLTLTPDQPGGRIVLAAEATPGEAPLRLSAVVRVGEKEVARGAGPAGEPLAIAIPDPQSWSPERPFLYDLDVQLVEARPDPAQPPVVHDAVTSYFGLRSIALGKDARGANRIFLNGEPLFLLGPLDQGWWPDGLYTAPTDAALRWDVELLKRLGFNSVRKHVKVEPARWYYHCDQLGLLVWQDTPNGDGHIGGQDPDLVRSAESAANYRREHREIIDALRNHPCIGIWVPFNEGWGQFETDAILAETKEYDPTRLVDGPSGWTDRGSGDLNDMHRYPGPAMPELEERRAVVLGEFGGLGMPVKGHLWQEKDNWGYRVYESPEELSAAYAKLIEELAPLAERGLAAAIYTQTSDVEIEVNGLATYDRAVIKLDPEQTAAWHQRLYEAAAKGASRSP